MSSAKPSTAGKPPSRNPQVTSASTAESRNRRSWISFSAAQNSSGMNAATRVCGQPIQVTMNPAAT